MQSENKTSRKYTYVATVYLQHPELVLEMRGMSVNNAYAEWTRGWHAHTIMQRGS